MIDILLYVKHPIIQHGICALLDQDDEFNLEITDCIDTLNLSLPATHYDAILFATKKGGGKFNRRNPYHD